MSFPLIYSRLLTILGSSYCKKQIDISFLCIYPLIDDKFRHNMSKFTAEPLACSSWFHSHFDNVMMQFIINKRTDAKKTDVNLLNRHSNAGTHVSLYNSRMTVQLTLSGLKKVSSGHLEQVVFPARQVTFHCHPSKSSADYQ